MTSTVYAAQNAIAAVKRSALNIIHYTTKGASCQIFFWDIFSPD
jgi:hypothetical protein